MFEFSVSKAMKKIMSIVKSMFHRKEGGSREGSDTFMSNTKY